MKPFNYALLKHFTKHGKSSVYEIMEELKSDYGKFKFFNKKAIEVSLLTAEANGLIEEVAASLDKNGDLVLYYAANEESKQIINSFIED
jgi:DNA-binding PadR family transcriptional regulator